MEKIDFYKWFDLNNVEHLRAYYYYKQCGNWPKDFIPSNVSLENVFINITDSIIANKYILEKINI